jgi:hypothetical protein
MPQLGQSVWRNVTHALRERWPQKDGTKAWVRTFRAKYKENAQVTVAKLRGVITKIIGDSDAESLLVSTPIAAEGLEERFPPPYHFLISGIPPEVIAKLLALRVCSCSEVSCFFVPFDQPPPNYAFTVENFTFPDSEASNLAIAEIVRQELRASPDLLQLIHAHLPSPDAEAAIRTIDSIRVSSLNIATSKTVSYTVWNVYIDSPPNLPLNEYFSWLRRVRGLQFESEDYGTGLIRSDDKQFMCVGCKSFDHATGLCPFPKLPGWFGPSTTIPDDLSSATIGSRASPNYSKKAFNPPKRGGGRGRGSRGRGRT